MDNQFVDRAEIDQREQAEAAKKKKQEEKVRKVKPKKPSAFVQILNGDFLTKEFVLGNLPFIFFVMLLLLLMVSKGYYGKRLTKDVVNTQHELNELISDHFATKTQLEEETRRKKLVDDLASSGLKETVNPTKVIRIKKGAYADATDEE